MRFLPSKAAQRVIQATRDHWESIIDDPIKLQKLGPDFARKIQQGFPELDEWTSSEHAERMLRAEVQDESIATERLIKAIECRVRGREIYSTLLCNVVVGDCRVIGRDKERRTVMYWCAKSQRCPLKSLIPQILITIEAAIKLTEASDCKICLIADMHNFTASHNLDYSAFKEIGEFLGSVYADRLCYVMVVDFSTVVKMAWSLVKPLMNKRTHAKISFVSEEEARNSLLSKMEKPTYTRIETAFDINRDVTSTAAERIAHAKRTSICDVPLGSLIEKAG
jgi:hypothetical protein